jgi:hypothetical protein
VPADIGKQVRRAERRRGVFVPLCVLAGSVIFCAGVGISRATAPTNQTGETGLTPTVGPLLLMFAGLLIATLVPALIVLLVIGRQQHLALLRWQRERRQWLARERGRYLASLPDDARARVLAALGAEL